MTVGDRARSVVLLDNTFEEAIDLAREARDYVTGEEPADLLALSPIGRLAASRESMRLTARLAEIVAWLLAQKAAYAGQTGDETGNERGDEAEGDSGARPRPRLGGQAVCQRAEPFGGEPLPERLAELLRRSRRLYERVARLDATLDRDQAPSRQSPRVRQVRS